MPRSNVLNPCNVVLFQALCEHDAVFNANVTKVINGKRNLISNDLANLSYVVLKVIHAFLRQVDTRCMMGNGEGFVILAEHHIHIDRALLMIDGLHRVLLDILKEAERSIETAGLVEHKLDTKVHLQEGEALFHSLFESVAHVCAGVLAVNVRIAVNSHLVAELATEKLIKRYAVSLAHDVPKSKLNTGNTAALSGMTAKLLDSSEELVNVAGILTENSALEHKRVCGAGSVSDFTVANNTLVCINFNKRAVLRCSIDVADSQVCDLKFCGV